MVKDVKTKGGPNQLENIMSDILTIDLWTGRFAKCFVCGVYTNNSKGIPVHAGMILPNDWSGEWIGADACGKCFDIQQGIQSPLTEYEFTERYLPLSSAAKQMLEEFSNDNTVREHSGEFRWWGSARVANEDDVMTLRHRGFLISDGDGGFSVTESGRAYERKVNP